MDQQSYSIKAIEILDAAERHMRRGGFDAVSFRDLAADVGIKSASVHYHFPQKADLGEAVVRRYKEHFLAALGAADDPAETVVDRIDRLCDAYQTAIVEEGLMCLCCVLGAESQKLPKPVADAVGDFFESLIGWTEKALAVKPKNAARGELKAASIVASLQGAMILALATEKLSMFQETRANILAQVRR